LEDWGCTVRVQVGFMEGLSRSTVWLSHPIHVVVYDDRLLPMALHAARDAALARYAAPFKYTAVDMDEMDALQRDALADQYRIISEAGAVVRRLHGAAVAAPPASPSGPARVVSVMALGCFQGAAAGAAHGDVAVVWLRLFDVRCEQLAIPGLHESPLQWMQEIVAGAATVEKRGTVHFPGREWEPRAIMHSIVPRYADMCDVAGSSLCDWNADTTNRTAAGAATRVLQDGSVVQWNAFTGVRDAPPRTLTVNDRQRVVTAPWSSRNDTTSLEKLGNNTFDAVTVHWGFVSYYYADEVLLNCLWCGGTALCLLS
jgi:hypothetical protein